MWSGDFSILIFHLIMVFKKNKVFSIFFILFIGISAVLYIKFYYNFTRNLFTPKMMNYTEAKTRFVCIGYFASQKLYNDL